MRWVKWFDWFDSLPIDDHTWVIYFIILMGLFWLVGYGYGIRKAQKILTYIEQVYLSNLNDQTKIELIEDIINKEKGEV